MKCFSHQYDRHKNAQKILKYQLSTVLPQKDIHPKVFRQKCLKSGFSRISFEPYVLERKGKSQSYTPRQGTSAGVKIFLLPYSTQKICRKQNFKNLTKNVRAQFAQPSNMGSS